MSISDKDREAFKEGEKDAKLDAVSEFLRGAVEMLGPAPPRSESEQAAYNKGKSGEQLDGDKK
jgi:hypothetical protein